MYTHIYTYIFCLCSCACLMQAHDLLFCSGDVACLLFNLVFVCLGARLQDVVEDGAAGEVLHEQAHVVLFYIRNTYVYIYIYVYTYIHTSHTYICVCCPWTGTRPRPSPP